MPTNHLEPCCIFVKGHQNVHYRVLPNALFLLGGSYDDTSCSPVDTNVLIVSLFPPIVVGVALDGKVCLVCSYFTIFILADFSCCDWSAARMTLAALQFTSRATILPSHQWGLDKATHSTNRKQDIWTQ
jgi:hypothetical protein